MEEIVASSGVKRGKKLNICQRCLARLRCCKKPAEDGEMKTRKFFVNDHERNDYLNDFNDNNIWTTKYTKWNFLPLAIIY